MPVEIKIIITLIAAALSYLLVTLDPNLKNQPGQPMTDLSDNPIKQLITKEDGTLKNSAKALIVGYLAVLMAFLWVFF